MEKVGRTAHSVFSSRATRIQIKTFPEWIAVTKSRLVENFDKSCGKDLSHPHQCIIFSSDLKKPVNLFCIAQTSQFGSKNGRTEPSPTTYDLNSLTPTNTSPNSSSQSANLSSATIMFSPEYEKRLLKHCSPTARRLFSAPESSSPSDRFIPCRWVNKTLLLPATRLNWVAGTFYYSGNNNWETNYSTLTKSNENSSTSSKKQRECGESARDSLAYSCLLKNELLGSGIEDIKNVSDEKILANSNRGLFKYQPPTRQVSAAGSALIDNKLQTNDARTFPAADQFISTRDTFNCIFGTLPIRFPSVLIRRSHCRSVSVAERLSRHSLWEAHTSNLSRCDDILHHAWVTTNRVFLLLSGEVYFEFWVNEKLRNVLIRRSVID